MNNDQIHDWESALDQAELSPLQDGLPQDLPAGATFNDEENQRKWLRVNVVRGNTGARWAYWLRMLEGHHVGDDAVADLIFNGDAAHFIGMLALPYVKVPQQKGTLMWVLIEPRAQPPPLTKVIPDPVKERYERSKEVYNVDTGRSERIP